MTNEKIDALTQQIAELTRTVQEHKDDKGGVDIPALAKELATLQEARIAEMLAENERNRPVRKGEIVGPPGFAEPTLGLVERGKFAGQKMADVVFAHQFLTRAVSLGGGKVRPPSKELEEVVSKALDATTAGAGDELVPTGMAAELWQDFFTASRVVSTLGTIPMPTDPFDLPLDFGTITWRKGTPNTAPTAQNPATAKGTLTATEQIAEVDWAYDLDEDGIVAVMPALRSMLSRDGAEQMDRFVINADNTDAATGNINLDDADPDADSYYLSLGQDGIRHLYLVDNTGQSADINTTLTDALMRAGISRLGKYGADQGNVVAFCDIETYLNGILALTNVATVDKYGPQATVLTGELAKYQGVAIVPTGAILEAEDDGKQSVTGSLNDEGQIAFVHRDMWKVGFRRELLIEVDRDIQKRQFIMVVSFRIAVAARGTRSSAVHTSGVHGIVRA